MGRKQQIQPFKTIDSFDMSVGSFTGKQTHVKQTDVVQIDVEWSGGQVSNGTIAIEATIDGIVWFELDFGSTISLAGASGNHQIIIKQVSFTDIRPVFTQTNPSATGTLTATLFATTVGA